MKSWRDGPVVTRDLVDHITAHRGISDLEAFINPQWPSGLHDPSMLPDSDRAVKRLKAAITKGEKIGIVGDYDMDGTPGAVLLYEFFQSRGLEAVVILPSRYDGYGFSPEFVERLIGQGVSLIVTVDCGIRDFDAVKYANTKKCDVIIIDHHECDTTLPDALAVVNPKRSDSRYPFAGLCGTGVAFTLLRLLATTKDHEKQLAWSLDLVALATLADMVPMVDENRVLVRYGLKVIKHGHRSGLRALMTQLNLNPQTIGYNDLSFKIIPKLNASGRLESMDDVFTLLTSRDNAKLDVAIKRILTRDTQRQLFAAKILTEAHAGISKAFLPPVIVRYDRSWHPGVAGLVAARLAETYNRPAGVLGSLDGTLFRGSFRSPKGGSVPDLLSGAGDLIEKFGGHAEAGGLTVQSKNLDALQSHFANLKLEIAPTEPLVTDGVIEPSQITVASLRSLSELSPWGMNNLEPRWSINQVRLGPVRWIGADGRHLKAHHNGVDFIYFGADAHKGVDFSRPVDMFGTLEINEFGGNQIPQMIIKGIAE